MVIVMVIVTSVGGGDGDDGDDGDGDGVTSPAHPRSQAIGGWLDCECVGVYACVLGGGLADGVWVCV